MRLDAPIAFAFAAGLVATVNPCGFAMLPAYLSYFLGTDDGSRPDAGSSVPRALRVGATVSGGFLLVFAIAGALVSAGIRSFIDYVPWLSLVIGLVLVALGIAMLAGYHLRVGLPRLDRGTKGRRAWSLFGFGISYAVASLSCTLPVFLTVVSGTVTRSNVASGVVAFLAYGLGMSLVLLVLTLALATAKTALVRRLHAAVRYVNRLSGALLILAGGYLVYYWATNLSTDPATRPGPARWAEDLSRRVSTWIDDVGPTRLGIILGGLLAAAIAYALTLRWLSPPTGRDDDSPETDAAATLPRPDPTASGSPAIHRAPPGARVAPARGMPTSRGTTPPLSGSPPRARASTGARAGDAEPR